MWVSDHAILTTSASLSPPTAFAASAAFSAVITPRLQAGQSFAAQRNPRIFLSCGLGGNCSKSGACCRMRRQRKLQARNFPGSSRIVIKRQTLKNGR